MDTTRFETAVPAAALATPVAQVEAGQTWQFVAQGRWTDWFVRCDAGGYRLQIAGLFDIRPRVPTADWFELVGEVVDAAGAVVETVALGCCRTLTFQASGELRLFANDGAARYGNNRGEVTVRGVLVSDPDETDAPAEAAVTGAARRVVSPLAKARTFWRVLLRLSDKTRGTLFIALSILAVCAILAFAPQGRDLITTVVEASWRDGVLAPQQIWLALSLLLLGVQAWFWSRRIIVANYGPDRAHWKPAWPLRHGPRLLGLLPLVAVGLTVLFSTSARKAGLLVLILALALAFLVFVIKQHDVVNQMRRTSRDGAALTRRFVGLTRAWMAAGLVLAAASMVLVVVSPVSPAQVVGPAAVVFLAVSFIIPVMTVLTQLGHTLRFPVTLTLVAMAVVFSLWVDNHLVGRRAFAPRVEGPVVQETLDVAYARWLKANPDLHGGKRPIVFVASQGGASRAGFWTATLLSQMEAQIPGRFTDATFAISSVSGGSVGAVGFVAARADRPDLAGQALVDSVQAFAGEDFLSPALAGLLFPDLLQRFLPAAVLPDRAEGLERSWEAAWRRHCKALARGCGDPDRMAKPYLSLWADKSRWLPLVLVNGADEESGRPMLTGPLAFENTEINALDAYDYTHTDVAASTAIHAGARFPWISPAGSLRAPIPPDELQKHVVDGGYFDAAGVSAMRDLATVVMRRYGDRDKLAPVYILIQYEDAPLPPRRHVQWANDALAPILAMLSSRGGHAAVLTTSFARQAVDKDSPIAGSYQRAVICQTDGADLSVAMDWALSDLGKTRVREAVTRCGNPALIRSVKAALTGP